MKVLIYLIYFIILLYFVPYKTEQDEQCVVEADGNTNCYDQDGYLIRSTQNSQQPNEDSSPHNDNNVKQKPKQTVRKNRITKAPSYLQEEFSIIDRSCKNKQKTQDCIRWAKSGACNDNISFMIFNCGYTCGYCHLHDAKIRCKRNPNATPAISKAGEVNAMFERAIRDFPQYNITIYSRDPWLITLDNVFNEEEAKRIIELGGKNFRRSSDAGQMIDDGSQQFESVISDARTSENDWCVYGCWDDPLIQNVVTKMENVTLVPRVNSEFLQVLKYEPGQYYVEHHDYIYGHLDLPIGPRLYTFFLYLNDVEDGGETFFNRLNISVVPKLGRVALWPSVLDSDPMKKDHRTQHEAKPVKKGLKFGANGWLHMYNFHDPYAVMCTG